MEYEYIVYKTTNIKNKKIYIGVHRSPIGINDDYIGNGIYKNSKKKLKKTGFQAAIKKYGFNSFVRETLFSFPDNEKGKIAAYKKEAELVNRDFLKRKDVYNLCLGGKVPSSANEKEVAQYDLNGKFLKVFYSIKQASDFTGISKSGIQHACSKETYCGNFQWRYFNEDKSNIDKAKTIYKKVYQFDLSGNYIAYYKSASDAGKTLGIQPKDISAVCLKRQGQAHGYFWSFKKRFEFDPLKSLKNIPVACYDSSGVFLNSYTSLRQAEKNTGISKGLISNCIKGKSKFAGKLRWRYFYGNKSNIDSIE